MFSTLSPAAEVAARRAIGVLARRTPLLPDVALSRVLGRSVWLKLEQTQPGGSYKIRPAAASLGALPDDVRRLGVVAASGGNFAISLALAARSVGVRATIVLPPESLAEKGPMLRGADVLPGPVPGYDAAEALARELAIREGRPFLSPTEGAPVYLGAQTIAEEIFEEQPSVSLLVGAVGGGGLCIGLAQAALPRGVPVLGASPEAADAMALSLRDDRPYLTHDSRETWAEPLMGGVPEENFQRAKSSLLGVERVAEDDIRAAMRALFLSHGVIVEAAGAVAYALARSGRLPGNGPVALVLSGGNLSTERRAEISA